MRTFFLTVFLLIIGFVGFQWGKRSAVVPTPEVRVEEPTPHVLVAIHELARLEGTRFHLERVIDLRDKQHRAWGLMEVEDAILLVAVGDVTAGVDLARVAQRDIEVDGERALVRLPRAELLNVRVDNERTYVHTRETDALAERRIDLETEARRRAERGFRQAALDGGILLEAERSVKKSIEALLHSLGFSQVEVVFVEQPSAERPGAQ